MEQSTLQLNTAQYLERMNTLHDLAQTEMFICWCHYIKLLTITEFALY